jgi:hypothetical protein
MRNADKIRTTVDIPAPLYRRVKEQAVAQGCSVRQLILRGMESILAAVPKHQPKRVRFPLIRSVGPKVSLANEQIYEHVEFP